MRKPVLPISQGSISKFSRLWLVSVAVFVSDLVGTMNTGFLMTGIIYHQIHCVSVFCCVVPVQGSLKNERRHE